jgi:hypothetical protein
MKKVALMAALLSAVLLSSHGGSVAAQETVYVPLLPGCNAVSSTYPDGTPIATIAGAVSPPEALRTIWQFEAGAGVWLGYSPQFPEASDLTQVDLLDVVWICVRTAATWERPVI